MTIAIMALGAVLAPSQDSICLPYAGAALQLETVTYFNDVAVVEVGTGTAEWKERQIETAHGVESRTMPSQLVRVVDSNFASPGQLELVFPYPFLTDVRGWVSTVTHGKVTIPLPAGRYIVSGRLSEHGKLVGFPGPGGGFGRRVPGEVTGTLVVTMDGSDDSFAVFSLFPTNVRSVPQNGQSRTDVLASILTAGLDAPGEPYDVLDFFLRIQGRPFPESIQASERVASIAKREAGSRPLRLRALLWAVAFKFGDKTVDTNMFMDFVASDAANPGWWDTPPGASLLHEASRGVGAIDDRYRKWLLDPNRQIQMSKFASQAKSDSLRTWILMKMTSRHDPGMNPFLRKLVTEAQPEGRTTEMLLRRMADLFERDDKRPVRRKSGESKEEALSKRQDLLDFWLTQLGG